MDLISKADMQICFGAHSVRDEIFATARNIVTTFKARETLGLVLVNDILNLRRADDEERPELHSFWNNFVREWAAWEAYQIMITTHGYNINAQGVVKFNDSANINEAVGRNERADLIKQAEQFSLMYKTSMLQALQSADSKFDGVEYYVPLVNMQNKPQANINAIGNKDNKRPNNVL